MLASLGAIVSEFDLAALRQCDQFGNQTACCEQENDQQLDNISLLQRCFCQKVFSWWGKTETNDAEIANKQTDNASHSGELQRPGKSLAGTGEQN